MSEPPHLSPLEAFAVAQAYVILADKKTLPEERANLVTMLGKHISRTELSPQQIQNLTADAFAYVAKYDFEKFLISIEGMLSPAQVFAVLANMYETMIVDGNVVALEKDLIDRFQRFFEIDRRVVNTMREILIVKNDTTLFLREDHPNNGGDFGFGFINRMDRDE